jgi:6-phosphogluconolactonase (cycloisomerase 2 family)
MSGVKPRFLGRPDRNPAILLSANNRFLLIIERFNNLLVIFVLQITSQILRSAEPTTSMTAKPAFENFLSK